MLAQFLRLDDRSILLRRITATCALYPFWVDTVESVREPVSPTEVRQRLASLGKTEVYLMWLSVEPVAKRTVCSFRIPLSWGLSGRLLAALATGRRPYGLLRLCEPPVDAQDERSYLPVENLPRRGGNASPT